jgi:SPP1 family predicted phage head-tail adaptor
MMDAGNLDQRITFQRRTETPDGGGGTTRTWANLPSTPTVWANVKAKGGRESLMEGRVNATFVVVFTIRQRSELTELDRIIWNGEAYNIRGILRQGTRVQYMQIEAERGVAD